MKKSLAGLRGRMDPVVALCAALLLVLLGVAVHQVTDRVRGDQPAPAAGSNSDDALDHAGLDHAVGLTGIADGVKVAEQQVHGLLTLNPTDIDEQLKTMSARTTGEFRRQFEALAPTFAEVVRKGDIDSRGEVVASALASVKDGTASVLVVSMSAVQNTQTTSPSPRGYRFRVDVKFEHGTWLVSGIEFV
ncbi:MAG TPA: hypothetical protein VIR30_02090 [Nocardioides sp.]